MSSRADLPNVEPLGEEQTGALFVWAMKMRTINEFSWKTKVIEINTICSILNDGFQFINRL